MSTISAILLAISGVGAGLILGSAWEKHRIARARIRAIRAWVDRGL